MQPEKSYDVACKINSLTHYTGYSFEEVNGQRIYGPPNNWLVDIPGVGTEVFVTNIPKDVFEDEIVPLFGSKGCIYQVRLMISTLGANRGFGYVRYSHPRQAQIAVQELNGYQIKINHRIGVKLSRDDNRVYVYGIPFHISPQDVSAQLMQEMYKAVNVEVQPQKENPCVNSGRAIITFRNHRDAALARNKAPWWIFNSAYGNLRFIWSEQTQNQLNNLERVPNNRYLSKSDVEKINVLKAILSKYNHDDATKCLEEICKTMIWQHPIYEETIIMKTDGHRWSTTITLPLVGFPLYERKGMFGPFNAVNHTKSSTRAVAAFMILSEIEKTISSLQSKI